MPMPDPNLVEFIKKALSQNTPVDVIRSTLLTNAWTEQQITEVFSLIQLQEIAPIPQPQSVIPPTDLSRSISHTSLHSLYSLFLAAVLLVSLFVLTDKIVKDLDDTFAPNAVSLEQTAEYQKLYYGQHINETYYSSQMDSLRTNYNKKHDNDVTTKLIVNTLIILPFWVISLLLLGFFRGVRKRYQTLTAPCYLTSVWLLLGLVFNVSKYILDKNATFGVYFVLIIVIGVLTGLIFAIQKYSRSN